MKHTEDQPNHRPLPISMLISETVYKIVQLVERLIRLLNKFLLRPCRLQLRCLLW